ncbi:phosphotransferase [Phytomonospora endophytica]|uniref:Ser/Thr protein kinase RdoA (MazF antagonist) n=1 Tax=Phytomonospora endophytica TaxID=714109 RepID=A0A841FI51_9ACTN|nr:phosphotransferase [Phytomonospora endophytica]MBB6037021.1 Ser/Thr protein kinase RdoA (MazF antagonist) [Phytomonospora endophytica]GIG69435.1 hypothetical protein Pen01_57300 [Phytomonospora endophytica]
MTAELDAVLDHYGLMRTGPATPLTGGADNDTVRVATDKGDVVVRRYLRPGPVRTELRFVEALARRGFPTPGPLRTHTGERLVPGDVPVAVFPFVEGAVPAEMTAELAVQCGRLLATLHTTAPDERLPVIDRRARLRKAIGEPLDLDGGEEFRDTVSAFLRDRAGELDALEALPSGALHHDPHRHNLLVADGEITALLDFGELNRGPLIVDLARAFHYLAVDRDDFRPPGDLVAAMLGGYGRVRGLSPAERASLQVAVDLVGLVDAAEFLVEHAPGLGYGSVESCHSWRAFRGSAGILG